MLQGRAKTNVPSARVGEGAGGVMQKPEIRHPMPGREALLTSVFWHLISAYPAAPSYRFTSFGMRVLPS
jgi:hypothetical protein